MKAGYEVYLKNLWSVSRYSVDTLLSGDTSSDQRDSFTVNRDYFLNHLYVERRVEGLIKRSLRTSTDLVFMLGPKGSGKSSISVKVIEDIRRSINKVFTVFIDFRKVLSPYDLEVRSEAAFRKLLRTRLAAEYLGKLFPFHEEAGKENPRVRLWAYLLHRADPLMPPELYISLNEFQNEAAQLFSTHKALSLKSESDTTYYDWLTATHAGDPEVKELIKKVSESVDVLHLIIAARALYGYTSQLIWVDNIDELPARLQSEIVTTIKHFHCIVADHCTFVIAVREADILRTKEYSNKNAYYPPGDEVYSGIGVPVAGKQILDRVIQKRLDFTRHYQQTKGEQLKAEIEELRRVSDTAEQPLVRQMIAEKLEDLSIYWPLLTSKEYQEVTALSRRLLRVLYSERAIYLANNSLRDFFAIYHNCLANLLEVGSQALSYDNRQISKLFFRGIINKSAASHFPIYDIVAANEQWYDSREKTAGCVLPYLVITTIWNLTLENEFWLEGRRPIMNPSVGEVMDRLTLLGYERSEILKCIYHWQGGRGNLIELRREGAISRADQIQDDQMIYLTHRAKCFVGLAGNTYGYVYECIRQQEIYGFKGRSVNRPGISSGAENAERILPFLCDMARMHCIMLQRIGDSGRLGGDQWLDRYRSWFGIPQLRPYSRRTVTGVKIGAVSRALQFEALISGLLRHFRNDDTSRKQLEQLQNLYAQTLDNLESAAIDFRVKMNIPPRGS